MIDVRGICWTGGLSNDPSEYFPLLRPPSFKLAKVHGQNVKTTVSVASFSQDWVPLEKNVAQTHDFTSLSENFFAKLGVVDGTISCVWDQSLNNDSRRIHNKRIFIAANFKDNEHVMPHLLVQLWHTIALLPEGAVFVSIYESSSSDQTGKPSEYLPLPS